MPQTEQSPETPSSFAAPQVNVPKGGGAIRGLGEKFQTNPVNGTATLSIPIPLSKSRSEFQPALALSYSSGSGNGPFGLGWTLGLPSISRRTDKGVPRYVPFARRAENVAAADAAADIFLLSGSEDLVPITAADAPWTAYREVSGYFVRAFRPRIEGTFSRIESWTRIADGDTHWRTISRDNVLTVYGETLASRIADPEDAQCIFEWLICRSYDDRGNAIEYEYAAEGDDGIDITRASERLRSRSANRYLKRVRYGNRRPVLLDVSLDSARRNHLPRPQIDPQTGWLFEAVLDYGDEPFAHEPEAEGFERVRWTDDLPLPRQARRDPFSRTRAGFEIRTHRLCQRILVAHRMPERLGTERTLVRDIQFDYDARSLGTRLARVTQSGYRPLEEGLYRRRSLPPLLLSYNPSPLDEPTPQKWKVEQLPRESLENLPAGVAGHGYQWIDLDGEGIAGVLAEEEGAWYYKPNRGHGQFGSVQVIRSRPIGEGGRSQLIDLDSDGRLELATLVQGTGGYFDRTDEEGWTPFRPFRAFPLVDFSSPNVRLTDLSGDGLADILIMDDQAITWHPSLGDLGFGEAVRVRVPWNEERGPRVLFGQADQAVFIADMSGDGLSDLVRVRNGEVCYWPNLGHGRFGVKVTMEGAPYFDEDGIFDARRIRFADVDGSGPTDVIYAGRKGVKIFLNESGNGLSQPRTISEMVLTDGVSLDVIDLLGRGTACLVWSTALPSIAWRPVEFIDLARGTKPHLLARYDNQLGAETRLTYKSSTEFYLADREAGRPWVTRLPFPVHVVERVEATDHISRNRFVTRFAYHHGHYDGEEREFRGFGMVEQWDTERFAAFDGDGLPTDNIAAESHVPPVHTKSWFHTGIYLGADRVSRLFEREYFREPGLTLAAVRTQLLDDTIVPPGLTPEEEREACRSLKGTLLRQEVYADDAEGLRATPAWTRRARTPYTITEQNFSIRMLQHRGLNRYAVFFTHERESITHHYERNPEDPRIQHKLTLEVDDYGNLLKQVAIAYGRRVSPLSTQWDRTRQTSPLLTYVETRFTNAVTLPDAQRNPLPYETITFELTDYTPTAKSGRFQASDFVEPDPMCGGRLRHKRSGPDIAYEATATGSQRRRPLEWTRTLYRRNDLDGLLPPGEVQSLCLPGESYKLAFTPGLLDETFQRRRPGQSLEALLPDPAVVLGGQDASTGGYVDLDGNGHWWVPSGRSFFHVEDVSAAEELAEADAHFFMSRRYRGPFGQDSIVDFDAYGLLITGTRDALGNRISVDSYDYIVMQPTTVSDANRNRTEVIFDTLGMVVGTAVMGKPLPSPAEGDSLAEFVADLDQAQLDGLFGSVDPHAVAKTLLKGATTRIVYDVDRFRRTQAAYPDDPTQWQPSCSATFARETHVNAPLPRQGLKIQLTFAYSDGFGREIQRKVQAEPGPLDANDPRAPFVNRRWVTTGWTIFNNKGKPVRQFEPFFSATHSHEFGVRVGVSPVLFYDPVGRVIATLHPNHTYEKVVFDAWRQTTYDTNDTCAPRQSQTGDPRTDEDIGGFVAAYFKAQSPSAPLWRTWHEQRIDGELGKEERVAAQRAAAHADTPSTAHLDVLGRPFLTVVRNHVVCAGHDLDGREDAFATRVELDIEGNQRVVRDAVQQGDDSLGRIMMRYVYDVSGNRIYQSSMEAGARWKLQDVLGNSIRAWDSRGHVYATAYDALRRLVETTVRGTSTESDPRTLDRDILIERSEYGEGIANAEALNLRTRIFRHFDSAGFVISARVDANEMPVEAFDFKGNLVHSTRRLVADYKTIPDWNLNPKLDCEVFESSTRYDALNRPIQSIAPRSSFVRGGRSKPFNVVQPVFNEANLLERVDVWLERIDQPVALLDPEDEPPSSVGVADIDYDAKGQRLSIAYKNGACTFYRYDPLTFRLVELHTRSEAADRLQNLHYTYDPSGNITHIRDDAQQTIFFRNKCVEPSNDYTYDALYRLIEGTGREHLGQGGTSVAYAPDDSARVGHGSADSAGRLAPDDGNAMGRYIERYVYDAVGNFLKMQHRGSDQAKPGWTRAYEYEEASLIEDGTGGTQLKTTNRLTRSTLKPGSDSPQGESYLYDAHGSFVRMPHLGGGAPGPNMHWDYNDQLRQIDLGGGGQAFYVYDGSGARIRKVWEKAPGLTEERIDFGGFEIFRRHEGASASGISPQTAALERETFHVKDDKQRIALVETRTVDTAQDDPMPRQLIRYQFGNHLGSACLELDDRARIISYEEYAPYGSSTYQAVRSRTDTPKRYRYSGKERDTESSLYYSEARYYADWLGRWTASDPKGLVDGSNTYAYVRNNPLSFTDSTGTQCDPTTQSCVDPTLATVDDQSMTCHAPDSSSLTAASGASSLFGNFMSIAGSTPPVAAAAPVQAANSVDDLLTLLHAQAGFETGAVRPPTFNSRTASPFGTAAHAQATNVLDDMKQLGYLGAENIYSEVRVVNGVVTQIGGVPGGPKGAHNLDVVVTQPGSTLAVGDDISGGSARLLGDLKYGGGVIDTKYAVHGSPLATINGRTTSGPMPAFPEMAAPGMTGGARWLAAGGGAFNAAGGVFMLASIDTEHDPGIVTAGKVTSGGASLAGGGMMAGGAWLGRAGLVAVGGTVAAVGSIIAAPIMVYEMRPRGWIAIDPVLKERAMQRYRNGENVNPFCAQCHGPGGALDPNNDWNAGGARRAAFERRLQWKYLGD
ncbi:RHS repeat-associated protein [Nitrobacter vulgaris]|uniref:SpvB/TcaC N-terminal domain-containing protein n=1 Tax=Nitrobacter vulgaris TaxID=29421 RepID=UPI002858278E|nr:SpvB/TcaC N-terminal domain-containing protein [Nitrobacter vulgaris]MDR6306114.1 RHS repeat-associated protein [Nitrobacter vulgaris]